MNILILLVVIAKYNDWKYYSLDNGNIVNNKCWKEGGGHSVFVTGADEGGVVVSSWGEAYYIKYEELSYAPFILTSSAITLN